MIETKIPWTDYTLNPITGHPHKFWVDDLIGNADRLHIPVFVKEPLASYMDIQRQEFPRI